jgi:transposase
MKKANKEDKRQEAPGEGWREGGEVYLAPPPPSKGRIVGLDCHPDTFTAAVFRGSTPHDARKLSCHEDMSLDKLLGWAGQEFGGEDLFVMEAGSNSFEVCDRLRQLGLRAVVLESCHVGRHAKSHSDNDRMAAARIARVYLAGDAPCVWVPDEKTRERRELLHAYGMAVRDHTAAGNSLKGYLNQSGVRLGKRGADSTATAAWILRQHDWSPMQRLVLAEHFANLRHHKERRQRLTRLIGSEVCSEPLMLRCMKLLGIGMINAFALLAVIGDIRRFEHPGKLVSYIGLNPGRLRSGKGKDIKLGVGNRGRDDMRALLIQAAHAVLRMGGRTALGKWAWKIFARKGQRNLAVAALARKLLVQVWHLLSGNPPLTTEPDKSFVTKLRKLTVTLGKALRQQLNLPQSLAACIDHFQSMLHPTQKTQNNTA